VTGQSSNSSVSDVVDSMVILTLSGPVMPCDIILLILSFICYNFGGLERVNPFHPKKCYNYFGLETIVAYEEQN
jgi:hypothetical protein